MKRMNKKGFTLIELLAVIIIMGILLLVAIPSVTKYINDSRKKTYISSAKGYIDGVRLAVSSQELSLYDTDITYYVSYKCIDLEKGKGRSPFGDWDKAYVIVTTNGQTHTYYWTSRDTRGNGVEITQEKNLVPTSIKSLTSLTPNIGVGNRSLVMVLDEGNCDPGSASTTPKGSSVPDEGGAIATGEVQNFDYTGVIQTVTLPAGTYKLEVWGAQGGATSGYDNGGNGGYTEGTLQLTASQILNIVIGGKGSAPTQGFGGVGGFGAGGSGGASWQGGTISTPSYGGGGGGGFSGIFPSTTPTTPIIIAGGGGGGAGPNCGGYGGGGNGCSNGTNVNTIGYGGLESALNNTGRYSASASSAYNNDGGGGKCPQGMGHQGGYLYGGAAERGCREQTQNGNGTTFAGGIPKVDTNSTGTMYGSGGGGGGYYGGTGGNASGHCVTNYWGGGGGGGSNYASTGLIASNKMAGNNSLIPNPRSSGNITGNAGNGYVRITKIS